MNPLGNFALAARALRVACCCATLLAGAGCRSIGPITVARDRFDYSASIGESWKRQSLLNIVKLRYLDPPIFVDVGQIVSGYTLQTGASVGGTIVDNPGTDSLSLGGAASYTDRPTITYTPLTGNKFIKSLMTPLPPESVFFLIQSGWPADGVLLTALASMNGLKNQTSTIHGTSPPSPEFLRAVELMRKIQVSGGVALRVQQEAQKGETTILSFQRKDIAQETAADVVELRRLLGLALDASEFKLVFGNTAANDREVAVVTRSILHLMQIMASQVEVPAQDLAQHRAAPGWESVPNAESTARMMEIHSSKDKPSDTFTAVHYRGHWFWIDDRDLKSKRVLTFMMMLFTLADSGQKESLPLITIPAQ